MEPEQTSVLDPHEILWKARRYFWTALLPIVAMGCAAFLYLRVTVPLYESGIVISVGERATMSQALEPLVRPDRDRDAMMANVTGVQNRVRNRAFLERISNRLGLTHSSGILRAANIAVKKNPSITREDHASRIAVALLDSKLTVAPAGGYVRIGAWDPSPDEARQLAAAIGEELIEDSRRGSLERVHARGEFSQDQIAVYNEKVRRSEAELRAYQETVIGHKVNTGAVNEDNVDNVRRLLDAAGEEIEQVRGRIRSDRDTWAGIAGSGAPVPEFRGSGISEAESQLVTMEAGYCLAAIQARELTDEAQTRLTQIGVARRELLSLYESAARAQGGALTPGTRQLAAGMALDRAVLRSIQGRRDRLNSLLGSYLNVQRSMPRDQMELERLRNEVQTNRDLLATLQREATSARLSGALETSQLSPRVEVVEPPVLPLYPLWPNWQKVLMSALLVGAVIAAALIFASERLGAIIRTVGQVEEELGAKVIGTIPRIEGWSRPGSYLANHWAPLGIVAVLLLTALATLATQERDKPPAATSSELRR